MGIVLHGKDFTPAPEGIHHAVCVDVYDKGYVETHWGAKQKVRLTWEIAETMADGRRFVVNKSYTASLHEKSTLRKDLKTWRGRDFSADELKAFDLESVLFAPCQVLIVHEEREGTVYANVQAVMRAAKGHALKASGKYVRQVDRDRLAGKGPATEPSDTDLDFPGELEEEETVPF